MTVTMPSADPPPPSSTRRSARRVRRLPSRRRLAIVAAVAFLVSALASGVLPMPGGDSGRDGTSANAAPGDEGEPRAVLVGIAGLGWSDVTAENTPTLYAMADDDAVASLTVRTVRSRTCVVDGWLTVSAGRRATDMFDADGDDVDDRWCRPVPEPEPVGPDGAVAVPGWDDLRTEQDEQSYDTRLGLVGDRLAETGACATAVGPGAALALADSNGRVDRYVPTVDAVDAQRLSTCAVTVIDLGGLPPPAPAGSEDDVVEQALADRAQVAATLDDALADVVRSLPDNTALLVAGISDSSASSVVGDDEASTIAPSGLRVAAATGPVATRGEFGPHWLTSSSTRWTGLVQLTDVAATLLAYGGIEDPASGTVGQPWRPTSRHPGSAAETVDQLLGTDRAAQVFRTQSGPFFQILGVAQVLFYGGSLLLLRRRRSPQRRSPVLRAVQLVALAAASFPVASYLANLGRWWRFERADVVLWSTLTAITVVVAVIALAGPWRHRAYGPAGFVAGLTATVLAVDVSTGSHLQHSSLLGLSPLVAGRFYGFGNIPYAIFVGSALVAAAALAQWLIDSGRTRRAAAIAVAVVGVVTVVIDGAPQAGADVGGIIASIPGFVVLTLGVLGRRVTVWKVLLAGIGAVALFLVVAWLDWLRPVSARTHFGGFFADLLDGDALTVVLRKARASLGTLQRSPYYGWLVPVAYVAIAWVVRSGRLDGFRTAVSRWSILPWLIWSGLLVGAVGFVANDSGIIVPAILLTIGIPLVVTAVALAMRQDTVSAARSAPAPTAARPG